MRRCGGGGGAVTTSPKSPIGWATDIFLQSKIACTLLNSSKINEKYELKTRFPLSN